MGKDLVYQMASSVSTLVHLKTREEENLSSGLNQSLTSVFRAQPYAESHIRGPKRHQEALQRPVEAPTSLTTCISVTKLCP